jgi:Polyketide cyclase / dehydrase and lipid transport
MGNALALFYALSTALVVPGYEHVGGHDGVEVYARKDPHRIELMTVGDINAPPEVVQAVLLDYANASRITKHLAESTILSKSGNELVVYQHLKLPVIKDRDYTLRVSWSDANHSLHFAIAPDQGPAPKKSLLRMPVMTGRWELLPLDGGRATRAVYHVEIDFGGAVSHGMVRSGSAKSLPDMYVGLRRETAKPKLASLSR